MSAADAPDSLTLLNALPSAVLAVDGNDRIIFVNHAAEALFATSATTLVGKALGAPFDADSQTLAPLAAAARERGVTVREYGVTLRGTRFDTLYVNLQVSPLEGTVGGVVLTVNERSIAHKLGNHLSQREVTRSAGLMADILAHEIKNPLLGIRGAAQLLGETAAEADRPLAELICREVDRIKALLNQMEIFSGAKAAERSAVNIHAVLQHARATVAAGVGPAIRFVEQYDPSLPEVAGDETLLTHVFSNLLANAADAVAERLRAEGPGRGQVTLTTRYRTGQRLRLSDRGEPQALPIVVTVEDDGVGIASEVRASLFDPFVTTKPGGKGLGLAIVAKLVGDLGGSIECESRPGHTMFRVLLASA